MKKGITRKLGWIRDLPDFRDKVLKISKPQKIPDMVDLTKKFPPVYNQLNLGSCVGQGVVAAFDYERHRAGQPFLTPSALFCYYNARVIDGTEMSDGGTTIRSGIKAVVNEGVCPQTDWPYIESKVYTRPTPAAYKSAARYQITEYKRLVADLQVSIYALTREVPFVFGFSVYESFLSDAVAKTGMAPMPKEGEGLIGGHCVVAVGFNNKTKKFLCRNSWGTGWGLKGHFYLDYEYLENRGLSDDFWSIRATEL